MIEKASNKKIKKNKKMYDVDKNVFSIRTNYAGPQKQLVYIVRFPVSYKNCQLLSERVSFTHYLDWMGQVREYSLRPVMKKITELTRSGNWGLATNMVKLEVYDLLKIDDVLEVRLWLDKVTGHDNIYHLSFDWLKQIDRLRFQPVAKSSIIITCVDIVGRGLAKITNPPKFLEEFFDKMKPNVHYQKVNKKTTNLLEAFKFGEKISDSLKSPKFISDYQTQATLDNSNLIGNVYFANYAKWINSTKDLFLYKISPKYFNKSHMNEEFVTINYKNSHFNEAMPFDLIIVKMYLIELFENVVRFKYEIYKNSDARLSNKLAVVDHTIAYVTYSRSSPISSKIPKIFIRYLNEQ